MGMMNFCFLFLLVMELGSFILIFYVLGFLIEDGNIKLFIFSRDRCVFDILKVLNES